MRQRIKRRIAVVGFTALVGALVALPNGVSAQQAAAGGVTEGNRGWKIHERLEIDVGASDWLLTCSTDLEDDARHGSEAGHR